MDVGSATMCWMWHVDAHGQQAKFPMDWPRTRRAFARISLIMERASTAEEQVGMTPMASRAKK